MIKISLIRHGSTPGNQKKRYIGTTDEDLSAEGIEALGQISYPPAEHIFVSPMKRCLQTAERIYPTLGKQKIQSTCSVLRRTEAEVIIVPDLRECDFGLFENKNYLELSDCAEYQQWIDSNGTLPFPQGESRQAFQERSCRAFLEIVQIMELNHWCSAAVVAHGGTIMSIMERFALPHQDYYSWQVKNGSGFCVLVEGAPTAQPALGRDIQGTATIESAERESEQSRERTKRKRKYGESELSLQLDTSWGGTGRIGA